MTRNHVKRILCCLIALCVLCSSFVYATSTARADIDVNATTSVEVTYTYNKSILEKVSLSGVTLSLYHVATVSAQEMYALTADFASSGITADDIKDSDNWQTMSTTVSAFLERNPSITAEVTGTTNSSGYIKFSGLSTGIYFIQIADATVDDMVLTAQPLLVPVQYYDATTDSWYTSSHYAPKYSLAPVPTPTPTPTPEPSPTPEPTPTPEVTPTPEPTPTPTVTPTPTPTPTVTPTPNDDDDDPSPTPTPTPSSTPTPTPTPTIEESVDGEPVPTPTPTEEPVIEETKMGTELIPEIIWEFIEEYSPIEPEVFKQPEEQIPQTGTTTWLVLPLAGVGAVLIIVGFVFMSRGKKE